MRYAADSGCFHNGTRAAGADMHRTGARRAEGERCATILGGSCPWLTQASPRRVIATCISTTCGESAAGGANAAQGGRGEMVFQPTYVTRRGMPESMRPPDARSVTGARHNRSLRAAVLRFSRNLLFPARLARVPKEGLRSRMRKNAACVQENGEREVSNQMQRKSPPEHRLATADYAPEGMGVPGLQRWRRATLPRHPRRRNTGNSGGGDAHRRRLRHT